MQLQFNEKDDSNTICFRFIVCYFYELAYLR